VCRCQTEGAGPGRHAHPLKCPHSRNEWRLPRTSDHRGGRQVVVGGVVGRKVARVAECREGGAKGEERVVEDPGVTREATMDIKDITATNRNNIIHSYMYVCICVHTDPITNIYVKCISVRLCSSPLYS